MKFQRQNNFQLALILGFFLGISAQADETQQNTWRTPEPTNLMYLELNRRTVLFELAPEFAPEHVANLRTLVKAGYFDGTAVIRSQDNYVAQWGDTAQEEADARSLGKAKKTLDAELFRPKKGLAITSIESRDAYADEVGFVSGFAMGADPSGPNARAWLTHCYGALGVGRGMELDSGNASSLYMVTGHSPRHLDRNVTLIGRVLQGADALSSLPRGTGPLGFYEDPSEYVLIDRVRMGDDVPAAERIEIEIMRTDSDEFAAHVKARTHRENEWFTDPTGKIEVCNVGVPTRVAPTRLAKQRSKPPLPAPLSQLNRHRSSLAATNTQAGDSGLPTASF